jgi:flagellar protein FlaE
MSLNPRDYDLDELRKMARKRGEENGLRDADFDPEDLDVGLEEDEDATAGTSYRAGLYRELLPFLGSDGFEKPYLRGLPTTYAAEYVVFEWLEFLLMHSGYQGATDALDYYESIDWITEDVEAALADYLRGIDDETANEGNELTVDDHLLSLVYVAKLQAME